MEKDTLNTDELQSNAVTQTMLVGANLKGTQTNFRNTILGTSAAVVLALLVIFYLMLRKRLNK